MRGPQTITKMGLWAPATGQVAAAQTMSITQLIEAAENGDPQATDRLLKAVYSELRRLAAAKLSQERPGQTLEATALVHEAYLRLLGDGGDGWHNRSHFFSAAAEAMRRILVEAARRKARLKHGGGLQRHELRDEDLLDIPPSLDLIALDEALTKLAQQDPIKAKLVKLRFFTGLTVEDAGKILGISRATADRYWAYARAWLYDALHPPEQATD